VRKAVSATSESSQQHRVIGYNLLDAFGGLGSLALLSLLCFLCRSISPCFQYLQISCEAQKPRSIKAMAPLEGFTASVHLPIPTSDIISWIYDNSAYEDLEKPVSPPSATYQGKKKGKPTHQLTTSPEISAVL
jgi:hypothetical protein